jgi:hypothetical protein
MPTCALFPIFNLRSSLRVWQSNYCESEFTECERYRRSKSGSSVPMNLLPNGELLNVPGKVNR